MLAFLQPPLPGGPLLSVAQGLTQASRGSGFAACGAGGAGKACYWCGASILQHGAW